MNAVAPNEPCALLAWDSEFFGRRIAKVLANALTAGSSEQIDCWCAANYIEGLYFIARSDDALTVRIAEKNGYQLADVRMTLERVALYTGHQEIDIRPASPSDLSSLRRIARQSHTDTRFYFDSHFSRERCDELYARWIESSFHGGAVSVAQHDGEVIGYVTHDEIDAEEGRIGLIAVEDGFRGSGVGRRLVQAAVERLGRIGKKRVSVVTQGRNLAAQRLYGRCGFVARGLQLYYHRWFEQTS